MTTAEQQGSTWQSWTIPLVAGFVFSTAAVALLVPPAAHSLTWRGLAAHSAGLLALAAAVAVAGVWAMHRTFRDYIGGRPAASVVACAWSAAIWLPLMLLLRAEHALWVMAAPLPITIIVTRFSKRRIMDDAGSDDTGDTPDDGIREKLFASVNELRASRMAGTALLAGALLQGVITATAMRFYTWAESLLILLTAVLVWAFSGQKDVTKRSLRREGMWRRSSVLPCFLLTCLALTPFLRQALASAAFSNMVLAGVVRSVSAPHVVQEASYNSIVLTTPPLPKHPIQAPAPAMPGTTLALRKPLLIPFDGVYWFFQYPDHQPDKKAPIERGDPTTRFFSSNSRLPLDMEAHQRLATTLSTDCCGGLQVDVKNTDNRIGAIAVEVVLRNGTGPNAPKRSLGTVPIRSSQLQKVSLNRAPVDESLYFRMRGASGFRFNSIDLIFHMDRDRNRASARVKVKGFVLEP